MTNCITITIAELINAVEELCSAADYIDTFDDENRDKEDEQ